MNTKNKLLVFVAILALLITTSIGALYACDIYVPWQKYNTEHKFPTTTSMIEDELSSAVINDSFTINFSDRKGDCVTLALKDYGTVSAAVKHHTFGSWLVGDPIKVYYNWTLNDKALSRYLSTYIVPNKNAKIKLDKDDNIVLIEDSSYHEFDVSKVIEAMNNCLLNNVHTLDLYSDDIALTYPAKVIKDDLYDQFVTSEWLNDFSIEYTSGKILDKHFFKDFYTKNYEINIDALDLETFLDSLEDDYDTAGQSWEFTKKSGKVITVTNVTFGSHVWRDKETAFIKDCISSRNSVKDRVPEFYGQDKVGSTYVEVDISNQHLYHFVNGKLCCDSSVVTGTRGVHDTPKGVFYISERIPGKTLRGPGYATYVNRWMRLTNSGVGLHDAYWRGSFGGSIYTYSGSHGCINLPKSFAYKLYDEVSVKTPVIIY